MGATPGLLYSDLFPAIGLEPIPVFPTVLPFYTIQSYIPVHIAGDWSPRAFHILVGEAYDITKLTRLIVRQAKRLLRPNGAVATPADIWPTAACVLRFNTITRLLI